MPTPFFLTGWEHGVSPLVTSGGGLASFVSNGITVSAAQVHTGSYALRIEPTGALDAYYRVAIVGTPTVMVGRFYFYISTEPTVAVSLFDLTCTTALSSGNPRIWINPTGDVIELRAGGTVIATSPTSYTVGTWHYIDFSFNVSANPWVLKAKLDGGTEFSGNSSTAADSFTNFRFGNPAATAYVVFVDDAYFSTTGADYPIGPGGTELLVPGSDGTHNAGTNIMEDNAGTDIGATTAFDKINSIPPSATTYIRQIAIGTGNYAEVNFADMTATYSTIIGAMGLLVYTSETTTTNKGACIISKDAFSTSSEVWGTPATPLDMSDGSTAAPFYKKALIANVDGSNVNSLQARLGYSSDATPDPYWIDLYVEVAYTTVAGPTTFNLAASLVGTSTLTGLGKNSFASLGTLAATSLLTSAGRSSFALSATLAGTSLLTSVGNSSFSILSTLNGTSSLTSALTVSATTFNLVAALSGSSSLSAVGQNSFVLAGNLLGSSALISLGKNSFSAVSSLNGTSLLTSALTISVNTYALVSSLVGTSALFSIGTNSPQLASVLMGTSALVSTGRNSFSVLGTLAGTSLLTSSGSNAYSFSSTIAGSSLLTVSGSNGFILASALQGISTLTSASQNSFSFSGLLDGTSSLTSFITMAGVNDYALVASLPGTSLLTALGKNTFTATGLLEGTSLLTSSGRSIMTLAGALVGSSLLTALGGSQYIVSSTLIGTSSFTVFGYSSFDLAGILPGSSELIVVGLGTFPLAAGLVGTSELLASLTTQDIIALLATLEGTSSLTALITTGVLRSRSTPYKTQQYGSNPSQHHKNNATSQDTTDRTERRKADLL